MAACWWRLNTYHLSVRRPWATCAYVTDLKEKSCASQEFDGEAAYAPFHEATFRHQVANSSLHQLTLMQQMLDWREGEIQNEISLLDSADETFAGGYCFVMLAGHNEQEG